MAYSPEQQASGGVPEHFNHPWHMGMKEGHFASVGLEVQWHEIKNGTGAMMDALHNNEVDVIVALTEGLVAEIVKGSDIRLLGTYVESPLNWGIITGKDTTYHCVDDLKGQTFAISRYKSGSHLMAGVLASKNGWKKNDVGYTLVGPFTDLRSSVNDGQAAAFMWEYFTTKPFVDAGVVRFIGNITTPWSCFMIAAREEWIESHENTILNLWKGLRPAVQKFSTSPEMPAVIAKEYGLEEKDAKDWYSTVKISGEPQISTASLQSAVEALYKTGVIQTNQVDLSTLVNSECALVNTE